MGENGHIRREKAQQFHGSGGVQVPFFALFAALLNLPRLRSQVARPAAQKAVGRILKRIRHPSVVPRDSRA
jgi:hypothetical protein